MSLAQLRAFDQHEHGARGIFFDGCRACLVERLRRTPKPVRDRWFREHAARDRVDALALWGEMKRA